MLRRLAIAVLAGLVLAATAWPVGAQQAITVPRPYAIPLPPTGEPNFAVGLRYWQSEGKTRYSIDGGRIDPDYGNPSSTFDYDGMDGFSGEFFWYARNETDTFAKGFFGGGGLDGGSLREVDYLAGQVNFLDTHSKVKGSSLVYGTIDLGQRFTLADGPTRVTIAPFAGFNFWQETAEGYGARCNPDDVGGALCGPPGSLAASYAMRVTESEANWASLRLGAELKVRLWDRLTLVGDAAVLPVAYVWNEDSRLLRANVGPLPDSGLGPIPVVDASGTGWGYQLEGAIQLDLTPCWAIGGGVRYWYAEVEGDGGLNRFESERLGVFGEVAYRFATF